MANLTQRLFASEWEIINYRCLELHIKFYVPKYIPADYEHPEEGGINDVEILKIEYRGENVLNVFSDSDSMLDEIIDILKLKLT